MQMLANSRRQTGFTVVELMIVVAVSGVLLSIALPAVQDWIAGAKVKATVSDLYASVIKARSEAITRNRDIVIEPVSAWAGGWTVKVGTTILVDQRQPLNDVTIAVRQRSGTTWSANTGSLVFKTTGRLDVSAEQVALVVSSKGGQSANRCVDISPAGRPSVRGDVDRSTTDACE